MVVIMDTAKLIGQTIQKLNIVKGPLHENLKPLCWLIGTWKSIEAKGSYPTIKPFNYCEEMSFTSVGQPSLIYKSTTWDPETRKPIHLEWGFIRVKPETNCVGFIVAMGFGLASIEEGTVKDTSMKLKTTNIGMTEFVRRPKVLGIERCFLLKDDILKVQVNMETENTPMTKHLCIVYEKANDC